MLLFASARLAPLAAALAILAGCASAPPPLPSPEPFPRAADGLLTRVDLQAVVDLQVLRDGPGLAQLLTEADPAVRARAAFALGSVQDEATIPALVAALRDSVPAVRADAAWALGQTADSAATPRLFMALRAEGTPAVQRQLLDAIGKIGSRADGDELLRLPIAREREADQMLALARLAMRDRLSEQAFAVAAQRLRAEDPETRFFAAYVFARSDGWGAQAMLVREAFGALAEGDLARFHLARAIGNLEEEQDAARLADALTGDPDWRTRVAAANALGRMTHTREARGGLFQSLEDEIVQVRIASASAIGSAESLPPVYVDRTEAVVAAADTSEWQVSAALLPALARGGRGPAVVDWLRRHEAPFAVAAGTSAFASLDDGDSLARLLASAEAADGRVRNAALAGLASRWRRSRESADAARYVEAFRAGVESGDLAAVTISAPVLADSLFAPFGSADALRRAYAALEAPADLEAMTAILGAIGQIRDEGEIDFLLDIAIGETDPALRRAAVDALNDRLVDGIDVDLTQTETARPTTGIDWAFLQRLGPAPRLVLTTTRGDIVIEMDPETAPQTVQSLTKTVREGLYDGAPFHRVVPAFVAQGGDYFRRDGYGGPETPIRSEFSRRTYGTGVAGMASSGKDTEGVQFFFMHVPHPHLDGRYTIWGQVAEGQAVVDALRVGDVIVTARVLPDPDGAVR
ncbi:MAG: peptidylprolyl isomerase [Bacteroidota bacterium]